MNSRKYRFVAALLVLPILPGLYGCPNTGSAPAVSNHSIVGTWTGQVTRATDSLSITFTSDGTHVTGQAVLSLLDEQTFSPSFLEGYATFPVTVSGNQATFTATFQDDASSVVAAKDLINPGSILIVIPGRSLGTFTANLNIGANTLTGTYQIGGTSPHNGTFSLTKSQPPPSLNGHWTGTTTSNLGQMSTTMDLFLNNKSDVPSRVVAADTAASSVNTTFASNTWNVPGSLGIDGILVGNNFYCNLNFVSKNPTGTSDRIFPHRYFAGTVNGKTITGVYKDEFTGQGLANDTGTFTLTEQ